jgi:hypothetical protein
LLPRGSQGRRITSDTLGPGDVGLMKMAATAEIETGIG